MNKNDIISQEENELELFLGIFRMNLSQICLMNGLFGKPI